MERLEIRTPDGSLMVTKYSARENPRGIAFLFPGRGYGIDQPPFHFLIQVLEARGYDVLALRYWHQVQGVSPEPEEEGYRRSLEEARSLVRYALERRHYDRIVLVGKSYGTRIMNDLCLEMPDLARSRLVYLTPVFPWEGFPEKFARLSQPALVVLGTRDQCYDAVQLEKLAAQRPFELTVLPNFHHRLEDPDDWQKSIHGLETICKATERFLDSTD
ncbi:MAG: alpha/beta hydrolase [Bacillota bacterium]